MKSLAEGKIWNHVKTGIIAKALRKFDVPIIYGRDYKMARRAVYSIENEKERHAILRQLKFDNSQNSADKIAHDDLFKNDQKLTMREALNVKESPLSRSHVYPFESHSPRPQMDNICCQVQRQGVSESIAGGTGTVAGRRRAG